MRDALDLYERTLKDAGATPVRCLPEIKGPSSEVHKNHTLWMCGETRSILDHVAGDKDDRGIVEKAMRWFGFVQDALWIEGFYSIEEMKNHNR